MPCEPELKCARMHRILYSGSGSGFEEAVPPKKPAGARRGNDADVDNVIGITDNSGDDHNCFLTLMFVFNNMYLLKCWIRCSAVLCGVHPDAHVNHMLSALPHFVRKRMAVVVE